MLVGAHRAAQPHTDLLTQSQMHYRSISRALHLLQTRPLRASIHVLSFSIALRLQYCFLVRSKTLSHTSTEAHRYILNSFFNQLTTSQLSFSDKVRPYVFICAVLYLSSFAFCLYSLYKTTNDTVQKRCKEWSSFQTELLEKNWKKIKLGKSENEGRLCIISALTGSYLLLLPFISFSASS